MKNKIYLTAIASAILLITPLSAWAAAPISPTPTIPTSSPADELVQTGLQQFRAKQFDPAIASWQQALKIYQQQKNHKGTIKVLEILAEASKMLGKYEQAIAYLQQLLALAQSLNDRQTEANALGNLGNSYRVIGSYAKALEVQNQGLVIRKELNDQQGEGQVLASLGNIHYDLGNYKIAINFYQRSLKIAKEVGNVSGVVFLLNSLGAIAGTEEEYPQAIKYYQQSLDNARKIGFREAEGNALNNIGSSYHVQRKYKEAIAYYKQALAVAKEIKNPRIEGAAIGGMGLAYVFLQEYDKALSLQEQSWKLAEQIGDRRLEAMTLGNWGYTLWRSQKYSEAEQKLLTSLNLLESLRSNLTDGDKVSIFDTQLHAFNLLQQIMVAQNKPESALEIAERGRARAFAELLTRRLGSQQIETNPKFSREFPQSEASLENLDVTDIRRIAKQQNAVMVEYSLIADPTFIGQGKLKGEYIKLYIWVVQPSGEIAFREVDLTKLDLSLNDLIADVRSLFNDSGAIAEDPKEVLDKYFDLKTLHGVLIQPIQDLLPQDEHTRVIFLPQGLLFLVPFAALINSQNQFLIEKHTVQIAPAIQVLDLTHQLRQQLQNVNFQASLIVGNPTMPSLGNPPIQLPTLLGAEKEAKAIASLLNTTYLTGDQATKMEVVTKMKSARFVHLATHGLLEEYRKGDIPGAIALAPSSTDDGFLTASEIVTMRLSAEMVVLSACKTGQGLLTGDGVIGLSRSLITAGVPSVVVSLWAVPDDPTALLMTKFYQKFQAEPNKAKAIRQAMLATKAKYPDPLNWAAFTLIGEN
ncbi:CHAT domain-containing tetratricopeptide repeat protein [Pseudanabaena galeata UHCC 0370]|uniref:CHAT domain-containing tetratricopeptide repeat protein n=1 Tax=Pseudanabaena galeata UHCC 0370 TaxID=3110310 RepID=A0ABU5THA5_9CYAN|nr:CHAT domain-containing tetratricopeptide repeat protein [Pseudanabaena galeata]MEA5477632.1 CHAT domain-containing tetratricopeptide repeat protein [Pseudanabaena galeata UHCC 0370]